MKWLFTFAVAGRGLKEHFAQACASVIEGRATVLSVERALGRAVRAKVGHVAFYRQIMEPREAVHRELAFWIVSRTPAMFTAWRMYVTYGVLAMPHGGQGHIGRKPPSGRDVSRVAAAASGRSAGAFLDAMLEAARCADAAHGLLVMTARMIGRSMAETDYR